MLRFPGNTRRKPRTPQLLTSEWINVGLHAAWFFVEGQGGFRNLVDRLLLADADGAIGNTMTDRGIAASNSGDSGTRALRVTTARPLSGSFALSLWARPNSSHGVRDTAFQLSDTDDLWIETNSGTATTMQVRINTTGSSVSISIVNGWTPGVWSHVIASWDDTKEILTVYFNGRYADAASSAAPFQHSAAQELVVFNRAVGNRGFQGEIEQFRIWNRALTATEAGRLYSEPWVGVVQPIGIPAYVAVGGGGGAINPPIHLFTGMAA